ncbi:MAG: ATP-binding protein [Patescibacteria group bacterium]
MFSSGKLSFIHYIIFYWILLSYAFWQLIAAYKKSQGVFRNQLKYFLLSSIIGWLGPHGVYLLGFGFSIYPYSNFLIAIYPIIFAYAILKYQLMDIKLIIKKAFFYSVGVGLVGGFITTITFLSYWFVANVPGFKFWTIPLIASVLTFWLGNLFWRKSKQVEKAYIIEKQAHSELQHLSEVKDQFILATQHHLRTPLTIMKGYLSAILDKDKTLQTQTKDRLSRVSVSTDRLIKLVNELLDISQLQVGKQPLNIHPINIRDIIDEILNEFQQEIQTKNLNIKLIPTNKQDWPLIPADLEKLKIALSNLIDNAVKYTPHQSKLGAGQAPKGEIIIQGKTINSSFQVAIKDNGIGVNPEEIPTLFTKYFERGEQAQKLYTTGRGIGLFIAASIIKAHNGRVWAESEGIGKGSVFYVEMPMGEKL